MTQAETSEWMVTETKFDGDMLSVQFVNKFDSRQTMRLERLADEWLRNMHAAWNLAELRNALEPVKRLLEGRCL